MLIIIQRNIIISAIKYNTAISGTSNSVSFFFIIIIILFIFSSSSSVFCFTPPTTSGHSSTVPVSTRAHNRLIGFATFNKTNTNLLSLSLISHAKASNSIQRFSSSASTNMCSNKVVNKSSHDNNCKLVR